VYDHFIEAHRKDFNQHTAMLTGNVCAIDHSFKVCNRSGLIFNATANTITIAHQACCES
jgi:hypothetical protein